MLNFQWVGIDVASDKFDVVLLNDNNTIHKLFELNQAGFKAFIEWLNTHAQHTPWVCMEATGHYSEMIADFLIANNIKTSIANPMQIKNFARATLTRNKNDKLDAFVIAHYCKVIRPREFQTRPSEQKLLREYMQYLDTLIERRLQLHNQLLGVQSNLVKRDYQRIIKTEEKRIEKVKKKIEDLIKANETLAHTCQLLETIEGIGFLTAARVLAYLPDVSLFENAKQLAAFVGLSPRQNESGHYRGKTRLSKYGNPRFRKSLYMPAMSVMRSNKSLAPFIERLKVTGLSGKAIIGALMRKLIHIIYGVLKRQKPFDAKLACAA